MILTGKVTMVSFQISPLAAEQAWKFRYHQGPIPWDSRGMLSAFTVGHGLAPFSLASMPLEGRMIASSNLPPSADQPGLPEPQTRVVGVMSRDSFQWILDKGNRSLGIGFGRA